MKFIFSILFLYFASGVAFPTKSPVTESSSVTPISTVPSTLLPTRRVDTRHAPNPYRYSLKELNHKVFESQNNAKATNLNMISSIQLKHGTKSSQNLMPVLGKSGASSTVNNEKNWLLTKAWLIDNINRLRRELSELERDYSQHLETIDRTNSQKEKQFIEDITKLRADHTVLSQQQKQIIYLIKKNQLLKIKTSALSENDIKYKRNSNSKSSSKSGKIADAPTKRPIKRDLSSFNSSPSESFESETRRNMKEMFAELSSLHDISLTLFDDIRGLEKKIDNRDKLFK